MMIRPDKPSARITIAQIGCCTTKRKKKIRVSGKYELRNSIPRISTVGIARILSHWQCAPCCTSIKSVSANCSGFPCTNEYSTGFKGLRFRLIYPMCKFLLQRRGFIRSSLRENTHKACVNQARQERLLRLAWQFTRTLGLVFGDATADALRRLKAAPERRGSVLGD